MPEKRKTESEPRDNISNFPAKRVRQQISYDDLNDAAAPSSRPDTIDENNVADASQDEDEGTNNVNTKDKQNGRQAYGQQPRVDPVYGQRSAFPGLDDVGSDELLYGPPEDGLEYLRLVRSEANSLPSLFVAPKPITEQDEIHEVDENLEQNETKPTVQKDEEEIKQIESDAGLVVIDGVIIARPVTKEDDISPLDENAQDARSSYYNLLKHRFILLRSTLRCTPPPAAIADLDESHPITLPFRVKAARVAWRSLLFTSEPQMVQLACMEMETILGVLQLLGTVMIKCIKDDDSAQLRRIGAWAWGLLGRCRDVAELSSEEVGELRVFGRKALNILKRLNRKRDRSTQDNFGEDLDSDHKDFSDNEMGDAEMPPEIQGTVPTVNGSGNEPLVQTVETTTEESREEQVDGDLEAAKARLHRKLLSSDGYEGEEEEELEADLVERQRRNTSSPLEEGEMDVDDVAFEQRNIQNDTENLPSKIAGTGEEQARILLDMIITIVGEFYGQKDLLQHRDHWD